MLRVAQLSRLFNRNIKKNNGNVDSQQAMDIFESNMVKDSSLNRFFFLDRSQSDRLVDGCDSSTESIDTCVRDFLASQNDTAYGYDQREETRHRSSGTIRKVSIASTGKIRLTKIESTVDILKADVHVTEALGHYPARQVNTQSSRRSRLSMDSTVSIVGGERDSTNPIKDITFSTKAKAALRIPDRKDSDVFDINASVKLSLQYFSNGSVLRMILLKTKHLGVRSGSIYSKVTLFRDGLETKRKSIKPVVASEQTKINQEILFWDKDLKENGATWILRVRVYYKGSLFAKKKCIGETCLSLNRFCLLMNTTCWCLLRPKSTSKLGPVCLEEDVQVLSRDRSIKAYASLTFPAHDLSFPTRRPSPLSVHLN